jgi:hypothetical protein
MVKTFSKSAKKAYDYPDDVMETVKINKMIRDDISKFCKNKKLSKSKLIENFYKAILIKFRDGSLGVSNGYITLNIIQSP